jgi:2,4-dienoyl-CoA reductase (NADPH2)
MALHERFHFRDLEALRTRIRSLGLDIPLSSETDILLRPFRVAGRMLPNRVAILPLEGADADSEGRPTELTFRRYRRFAQSGCGLVWFEAAAVVPEGRSNPRQLHLGDRSADGFKRLVEETRRAAGPAPLFVLQLTHAGRFARPGSARTPLIAGRSPELDRRLGIPGDHPLLPDSELDRLSEVFARAARLAATAGFDAVDIKACHGYLVSDLLAASTRPDSRYGGSFDNRSRFLLETAGRIRAETSGLFVTSRLSAYDGLAHPYGFGVDRHDESRADLSEPKVLAASLRELGAPFLGVTLGIPFLKPHLSRPYDRLEQPPVAADEHPLQGVDRFLRLTGALQREFPDLPLVGAGYSWLRRFWPQAGAGVLRQGGASLIGLGRAALAYPDALRDLASTGRLAAGKVCTTCSRCSEMLSRGENVGCSLRDREFYGGSRRRGSGSGRPTA